MNPEILALLKNKEEVLEPETLRHFSPEASEEEINRTLALAALHKTRIFWENFYAYEDITQALNGMIPVQDVLQGCTPEQMWYSLEIAHSLYPEREFAPEVLHYIEFFSNEYGVFIYPPFLPIDNPYYAKAAALAEQGPFPLGETTEEIQAAKYLGIRTYVEHKKQEN